MQQLAICKIWEHKFYCIVLMLADNVKVGANDKDVQSSKYSQSPTVNREASSFWSFLVLLDIVLVPSCLLSISDSQLKGVLK